MEENLQILIDNIWETNTNSEELIIQKLYKICFESVLNKEKKVSHK